MTLSLQKLCICRYYKLGGFYEFVQKKKSVKFLTSLIILVSLIEYLYGRLYGHVFGEMRSRGDICLCVKKSIDNNFTCFTFSLCFLFNYVYVYINVSTHMQQQIYIDGKRAQMVPMLICRTDHKKCSDRIMKVELFLTEKNVQIEL